jgi:sodium pump decarboxylase gamma subunit
MENLAFGLNITLIGMSLVFGLLALLWLFLTLIGKLDREPKEEVAEASIPQAAPALRVVTGGADLDDDTLAAITIAVLAHAAVRRQQGAPAMRSTWPGSQIYASRWLAAGRTRQTRGWNPKR